MRTVKHIALIALASAALACAADVTRQTEWQDVPPGTTIGTVVDLGQGGGLTTNDVSTVITNHVTSGYLATAEKLDERREKTDLRVYNGAWGDFIYRPGFSSASTPQYNTESGKWECEVETRYGKAFENAYASGGPHATFLEFYAECSGRSFTTRLLPTTPSSDTLATSNMVSATVAPLSQSLSAKLDAAAATNVAASASVTNAGAVAYVDAATNAVLRVVGFANEMLESAL